MIIDALFALLLFVALVEGMRSAVRIRKQNITRDREAALARLDAHPENALSCIAVRGRSLRAGQLACFLPWAGLR